MVIYTRADQPALGPDVMAVIHEDVGIVMTYAFSKKALDDFRSRHHGDGEWEGLDHAIFELPEKRATRACIELAIMLRALDEAQNIRGLEADFGKLYDKEGKPSPLSFREVFNKIIHATSIKWDFSRADMGPVIVCEASQRQVDGYNWTKAEIRIDTLGTACGVFA